MKLYQKLITMHEEYNIYYKNIIQPYNPKWDVVINCAYGKNLGNCWRLSDFAKADIDGFDFEIVIYGEHGECLASKKCKIVMVNLVEEPETDVLFFGDSMTQARTYVNHISETL